MRRTIGQLDSSRSRLGGEPVPQGSYETSAMRPQALTRLIMTIRWLAIRRGPSISVLPMSSLPTEFPGVTVHTKANVYFDGKVVSHTVLMPDGTKKTLGLIYPGSYHFGTAAPERMEIVAGACTVTLDGTTTVTSYAAGQQFDVPGHSGFTIASPEGICEYICSFL